MSTAGQPRAPGRVLVVTNDFPTRRGGIETFVLNLCRGLEALAPGSVVVHTASMDGDAAYDAQLPFPVVRDPTSMLVPSPAVRRRVVGTFEAYGCDRVLFGAAAPLGLLADALRTAGAERIVGITHGHEVWWARVPGSRAMLRRIGAGCDVLTYVSEWCRERIAAALDDEAAAAMRVLRPGVDLDRFRPGCGGDGVRESLGLAPEVPVVVCTARFVRRKGQDRLVEAWPEVLRTHPDAVLLLVGDGPDRERVMGLVADRGLQRSVLMPGSVPWEEVPAWTDAGDVFAMPCRTRRLGLEAEAFGIVYLEAAACGLPVVGGPSGGAPEAVELAGGVVAVPGELARVLVEELGRRGRRERGEGFDPPTWSGATGQVAGLLGLVRA
ncbi:glycosyltransferase family 4 protein [Nocardioidaceae bacterium]|nr:glycosyltransferase family 4 protein [Nocardioidaceae bacterium]